MSMLTEDVASLVTIRAADLVPDVGFAEFEKHTTGYGSRMLAKMGFKGRLGKSENGIINPVLQKSQRLKQKEELDPARARETSNCARKC